METVALVILLILALALIGVVLLQRNEGGGLGMGGGGGGAMSGRAQANALSRATWWIGGAFMAVSLALVILAAQESGSSSVVDQINAGPSGDDDLTPALPDLDDGGSLLPPPAGGSAVDAPLVPTGD